MSAVALPVRQRTPEWGKARQGGIGSSDAAVIAGVAPWGDIRTLFAEKVGWAAPSIETKPMRWGHALEQVVAEAYAEETGRRVRRVRRMQQHRERPWMLASLDRVAVGERRLVEIKTARFADERWGPAGTDEVPDHYRLQVLHAMGVTGYEVADVVVLFAGSDLRIYTVPRDDELLADLVTLEDAFWQAVQARALPAELADLGPRPVPLREGEVLAAELDPDVALLAPRVAQLRHELRDLEAEKEATEASLKEFLADYTAIRGDRFRITYKPQAGRRHVGWEQIAGAYRTRLEELGADPEQLDTLQGLFTTTAPAVRPLRITMEKETDDAPL